jgi:hypothetical protein
MNASAGGNLNAKIAVFMLNSLIIKPSGSSIIRRIGLKKMQF